MPVFYTRYADPRATFVMIEVRTFDEAGRPTPPFHLRVTEEEFRNMMQNSHEQSRRNQWPPPAPGRRWRPADPHESRSYPANGPYWNRFDDPFFEPEFFTSSHTGGPPPTAEQERRRKEEQQRKEEQKTKDYWEAFGRKQSYTPPSPSEAELKKRLGELAGTAWIDTLDMMTVYKKARRRCHPDMPNGSHELWIELEEIAHMLGIVIKKKATR